MLSVGALSLCGVLSLSTAHAFPTGWSYHNFDVFNETGQDVNDLHVELHGADPDEVSDYYTADYENVSESGGGGITNVDRSTGGSTPAGEEAHFGYALAPGV